jgi:hypothetical protein
MLRGPRARPRRGRGRDGTGAAGSATILDHVRALAADTMEGRQAGTPGAERAAEYIGRAFQDAGLQPAGDAGRFGRPSRCRPHQLGAPTALTVAANPPRSLTLGSEFAPLAVSDDGLRTGEIVFVGYGITAPDLGWDDYAGLDVRDKIVLALTREPRWQDPASPFRRPDAYHYAERSHKLINARQHGARALLLVNHPGISPDGLPALRGLSQPLGIVAAAITRPAADALLRSSGQTVASLAAAIDGALRRARSRSACTRASR